MIFGIDLGNSYSSIGLYDPELQRVRIAQLRCENGSRRLPSAVYIESPDNIVVGSVAINAGAMEPERLFRRFERDFGSLSSDRTVDGQLWTPVELCSEVLRVLKQEAEEHFNTHVKEVVITIPPWFASIQGELIKKAAEIAGLEVMQLCEESHAIALAWIMEEVLPRAQGEDLDLWLADTLSRLAGKWRNELGDIQESALLVCNLDHNAFEVVLSKTVILHNPKGQLERYFQTVDCDGDVSLGSGNWNKAIMQLVADKDIVMNSHNFIDDPSPILFAKSAEYIEESIKNLIWLNSTMVLCPDLHSIEINRKEVNEVTAPLLDRTKKLVERVIFRAGQPPFNIKKEQINMLTYGGMSYWPAIREMQTLVMDGRPPRIPRKAHNFFSVSGAAYAGYMGIMSLPMGEHIYSMWDEYVAQFKPRLPAIEKRV